uniref:Uncharacterized protein n=1 Tax=Mus musculus TaxID=10090 RepID=Q8C666_MOUSE|nr:unnamed protein product [Mus musculus]
MLPSSRKSNTDSCFCCLKDTEQFKPLPDVLLDKPNDFVSFHFCPCFPHEPPLALPQSQRTLRTSVCPGSYENGGGRNPCAAILPFLSLSALISELSHSATFTLSLCCYGRPSA